MTLVDRKARFLVGKKLVDHRAETLKELICKSLKALPCHTWTVDNGKELAAHRVITAQSNVPVSFAHRQSAWETPTNEHANGLLRQFFSNHISFLTVTQQHLDYAIHLLNNRPRNASTGKLLIRSWQKNCCTWFDKPQNFILSEALATINVIL
jgi:transposase, IS30 family